MSITTRTLPLLPLTSEVFFPEMVVTVSTSSEHAQQVVGQADTGDELVAVPQRGR